MLVKPSSFLSCFEGFALLCFYLYLPVYSFNSRSAQYCSPAPHSAITPHGVPAGYGIPGISWNLPIALLHRNITECISNLRALVDSGGFLKVENGLFSSQEEGRTATEVLELSHGKLTCDLFHMSCMDLASCQHFLTPPKCHL